MTNEEFLTALRCCMHTECSKCPLSNGDPMDIECVRELVRTAADLIEKLTERCARYAEEIAVLQEREKWVPVTERLPDTEEQDYVLVCVTEKCSKIEYQNAVVMAFVSEEGFVDVEMDYLLKGVTHWRPLPDGPEVE